MGQINSRTKVKLIVGFIFKDDASLKLVLRFLNRRFGSIDFDSSDIAFIHTDYYKNEFGDGLKRRFVSFKRLILPEKLPKIKLITNSIERKLSKAGKRCVNIDPGYLDSAKLVLATTKDFVHRLYLAGGIYAEVTLFYKDKTFNSWPWTYPDYRSPEYIGIFNKIRSLYLSQL